MMVYGCRMATAAKLATYDDLLALPEEVRAEVLGGELVTQPSGLPEHGRLQAGLGRFLGGPFDFDDGGPGGWWIVAEIDVRFGPHDITRPDVAGWRRERLASPWGKRPIDVVPDWICEILSPSSITRDRVYKQRLYARHGVPFYWLIDPAARTLEALALEGGRWVVVGAHDATAVVRVPPFDAVELPLGRLFPPDVPTDSSGEPPR